MGTHDVTDFDGQVLERSREVPVLVDFWAEWCGPCRSLGPVIEKLAGEAAGRWELAKVDTEALPEIAGRYAIRSIPAVKLFVDGAVVDEFVGALPEPQIREWLERVLPSPHATEIARAAELGQRGEVELALAALDAVLAAEPANEDALMARARLLLWEDPTRALESATAIGLASAHADAASAIRTVATLFDTLDAPERLPEHDQRTTYLAAIAALRGRDFPTALDGFITVLARDRSYDDDGARRACLAIFLLLGEDDPVTRAHRPVFASAVYA